MANPRRGSRKQAKATTATTLRLRRTYEVLGQVYSRVLFPTNTPAAVLPVGDPAAPPLFLGPNLFDRADPAQQGMADYPLCVSLSLFEDSKGGRELEETSSEVNGQFRFRTQLEPGLPYRLEAILRPDLELRFRESELHTREPMLERWHMFSERIVCSFTVEGGPARRDQASVNTVHHLLRESRWTRFYSETLTARIDHFQYHDLLFLTCHAALVFNTFALKVPYRRQYDLPLQFHTFEYDGKVVWVELKHLCLATCVAMILNYYGVQAMATDVAEAAARQFLDIDSGKAIRPQDFLHVRDPSAGQVVQLIDPSHPAHPRYAHNVHFLVAMGARALMNKAMPNRPLLVANSEARITESDWWELRTFIGRGWPFIVIDDLPGQWDHARVGCGLVVDDTGRLVYCYVNDPRDPDLDFIHTSGSQSELGWLLLYCQLSQSEVSPERLVGGGRVPAPERMARGYFPSG